MKATGTRWLGMLLLVAGLASLATGMGVLLLTSPKWYVASARVKAGLSNDDTQAPYDPFFLQNECALIQSPALLTNVIAKLDLQTPAGRKLRFLKELRPEDACAFLQSSFNVRPVRSTSLAEIRVSHDDPDTAALTANAIAEAYCELPSERRRHYDQAEIAVLEAYTRQTNLSSEFRGQVKATLLAAQEARLIFQVNAEIIDLATPPTSQVSLEERFDQWLNPGSYRRPGPPAHPHLKLSLGLVALGLMLGVIGLVLRERPTT
jgi:capsular polysaccharide biosynthesis protein